LSLARKKADEARQQVRNGIDPSDVRKAAKKASERRRDDDRRADEGLPPVDSFEAVAREWYEKNAPNLAATHSEKIIRRLERDVFPWIGKKPVGAIRPAGILELLRRVESRGAIETTHRVQQNCGQVFRYAVATSRAESDPSRDLRGALTPWKPQHYATLTEPREVGRVLHDIESYEGSFVTKCAMKLSPMLFVRPGELRRAEWSEIDLEKAEWRIPATKMKGRVMHIVPLAKQAVRVLAELKPLTDRSAWVFPGVRTNGDPMSENTVNAALRRLGYDRATLTAHGFGEWLRPCSTSRAERRT
jgi:integrase